MSDLFIPLYDKNDFGILARKFNSSKNFPEWKRLEALPPISAITHREHFVTLSGGVARFVSNTLSHGIKIEKWLKTEDILISNLADQQSKKDRLFISILHFRPTLLKRRA